MILEQETAPHYLVNRLEVNSYSLFSLVDIGSLHRVPSVQTHTGSVSRELQWRAVGIFL